MNKRLIFGQFDPLTLSIYESSADISGWRKTIDTELGKLAIDSVWGGSFEDFVAYSVSLHENDHFIQHTGSEIGVLITILQQLRYASRLGLWYARQTSKATIINKQFQIVNDLDMLYIGVFDYNPRINQGSIVKMLNNFYKDIFGIDTIFVTSNPDKSHCPESRRLSD